MFLIPHNTHDQLFHCRYRAKSISPQFLYISLYSHVAEGKLMVWFRLGHGVKRHFQQYVSYNVAVSFIGGGNRSTQRKPPTCRKSLTNFIT